MSLIKLHYDVFLTGLLGCFKDKLFRAMIQKHDVKSIEECMAICHKMGSKIAGLEVSNI